MEVQFNTVVIPCQQTLLRQMQTQEQTQEVRLTDDLPDIGRVLASWGQILVRGKEWHAGTAGLTGGVMVWTLYEPEDGSQPQSIASWLPFQIKWGFPETDRDGTLRVMPMLRSVDARTVSARKLMVRAGIGMLGEVMAPAQTELFVPGKMPEDIQVLKNAYPMQIPKESGEKAFALEETLSLPASAPELAKLVRFSLQPELVDQKIMADKVVMRGAAILSILYAGTDGQLHSWNFEIPFSQYAQLDAEYDTDATAQIWLAVTALELEQGEEGNLDLKAGLTGQYVICQRHVVEVVEDAYSPVRDVIPQMSRLQLPALLDDRTETVHAELTAQIDANRVVDTVFYPDPVQLHTNGDLTGADMTGVFQVLGVNADGQLQGVNDRWEGHWSMHTDADTDVEISVQPSGSPKTTLAGGNADMRADMLLHARTMAQQGLPMATGLTIGEENAPDANRPSLILRRVGTDRLWDLAKRTGSTVEAIRKANDLQQEPQSDRILLIPVN